MRTITSKLLNFYPPGKLYTPRDGTAYLRSVNVSGYFTGLSGALNDGELALVVEASDVNVDKNLPVLLRLVSPRGETGWVYANILKEVCLWHTYLY
jgi:hypothetical protein